MPLLQRFVALFLFIALGAGCSRNPGLSVPPVPTSTVSDPVSTTAGPVIVEPSVTPFNREESFGATITVLLACTDGTQTVVEIETELDLRYWRLHAAAFSPSQGAYFETATVFLENGRLFSATSSGERAAVEVDQGRQAARVRQKFIYPRPPRPNSQYLLRAEITLSNLPPGYAPPPATPALVFFEPGMIVIPMQFEVPVVMVPCR